MIVNVAGLWIVGTVIVSDVSVDSSQFTVTGVLYPFSVNEYSHWNVFVFVYSCVLGMDSALRIVPLSWSDSSRERVILAHIRSVTVGSGSGSVSMYSVVVSPWVIEGVYSVVSVRIPFRVLSSVCIVSVSPIVLLMSIRMGLSSRSVPVSSVCV